MATDEAGIEELERRAELLRAHEMKEKRLTCLSLAISLAGPAVGFSPETVVSAARKFMDFIKDG